MENIEKFSLLDDKPTMATDHTEVSGERDALDIGMEYNDNKADGFAQCVLDDIFGQGYLLAKSHLGSRMPSDEEIKGIAIYNELKGITKVELALSDNAYTMIGEYLYAKFIKYPVRLERFEVSDMLLEFLGIIDRKIKSVLALPQEREENE